MHPRSRAPHIRRARRRSCNRSPASLAAARAPQTATQQLRRQSTAQTPASSFDHLVGARRIMAPCTRITRLKIPHAGLIPRRREADLFESARDGIQTSRISRRTVAGFDTNFRKHLRAKAEGKAKGGGICSAAPARLRSRRGRRMPETGDRSKWGGRDSPAPGVVPPAGGDGEYRWTPEFFAIASMAQRGLRRAVGRIKFC